MEIIIKASPTEITSWDNQPCEILKYRLTYPFTLPNFDKQVVWKHNETVIPKWYRGGHSKGDLYTDLDVARKIEIKNTDFNTIQKPNDFPKIDDLTTPGSFIPQHFFSHYSIKKNICLQTQFLTIPDYGEPNADQYITFQKKHFCTVIQDDVMENELVIIPKLKRFSPYMLPTTLEEARKTLCFTFRHTSSFEKNKDRELHLFINLQYEH